MKPKFEFIKSPEDVISSGDTYFVLGGRGCGKSLAQLNHMKDIITLYDDIEACNIELAKIERRNNDRTN